MYFIKGCTINTKHVIAMIDMPKKSAGHVDSLVQGLVGRACGYKKNENIRIYTNINLCKYYINWVNDDGHLARMSATAKARQNQLYANKKSAFATAERALTEEEIEEDFQRILDELYF